MTVPRFALRRGDGGRHVLHVDGEPLLHVGHRRGRRLVHLLRRWDPSEEELSAFLVGGAGGLAPPTEQLELDLRHDDAGGGPRGGLHRGTAAELDRAEPGS